MRTLKKLFTSLFLLYLAGTATAQDVIVKKDQSTVMSKVLEITSTEIKYKKWNNQDGPTYTISRSEVTSINYENGETEKFTEISTPQQNNNTTTQVQYLNSYMTYNGSLCLNGRKLSDEEALALVGSKDHQLYHKGERQIIVGALSDIIGTGFLAASGLMSLICDDAWTSGTVHFKEQLSFLIVGATLIGTGWIVGSSGSNKIDKVVETYNKNHGTAYFINISPSLMRCEAPQSQGDCGMGLTVSMNF